MKDTGSAVNLIGKGTTIVGTVTTNSSIIIHGKVDGDVNCADTITIGADGVVEGNVKAKNAIVGGVISGTVNIGEKIVLESKSSLIGELKTSKLVIDEGAVFDGKSLMGEKKTKASDSVDEQAEEQVSE